MKKIFFVAMLTISLLFFCSCNVVKTGNDNDNKNELTETNNFEIVASRYVSYATDTDFIELGIKSTQIEIDESNVTYEIVNGKHLANINEMGVVNFNGSGVITVKAKVDEKESVNTISLYSIRWNRIDDWLLSSIPLNSLEIGDVVQVLKYSSDHPLFNAFVIDVGNCLRVNEKGEIEVVGITDSTTITLSDIDGKLIWNATLSTANGIFGKAIRESLLENGTITEPTEDIYLDKMENVKSLNLSNVAFDNVENYKKLDYFPKLEQLDLSSSTIFDLSFLNNKTSITKLILENITSIDLNLKETIFSNIDSLIKLDTISIKGSFGAFDKDFCNELVSRVKQEKFKLKVLENIIVDKNNVEDFFKTVLFSLQELNDHLMVNNGYLTPTKGFYHSIINLAFDTSGSSKHIPIKADNIKLIEMYGGGKNFHTSLSSTTDLTINMYDYGFYMGYIDAVNAIKTTANLRINAIYGTCWIKGGDSVSVTDSTGTWFQFNGSGIVCNNLELFTEKDALLQINGGNGNEGPSGIADGSNPKSPTSQKHGSQGYDGKCAIDANNVTILGGTFYFIGGAGGRGGLGGDGSGKNIFNGGYDAGNGGDGGDGGCGIYCSSYNVIEGSIVTIEGGRGGDGREGGNGYLAGKDGGHGLPGDKGKEIVYK